MKKTLTCIVCPLGCQITLMAENNKIINISGNTCPKGETYATNEYLSPKRVVTSTILTDKGSLLSVKTDNAIPKNKMKECMSIINSHIAKTPVKKGDVIIKNVFGSNVVATQNKD